MDFSPFCHFAAAVPQGALNAFDDSIIPWICRYTEHSWIFDYTVFRISDTNLLKGGIFLALLWAFWFRRAEDKTRDRTLFLATLGGCVLALAINKVLQIGAPHRLRPYLAGVPGVTYPYDLGMVKISSFPSDHASLFFALATGLWLLSRRTGIFAFAYAIIVICLPRIYLGLHYPSDLLAGAVVGTGSTLLVAGTGLRGRVARQALAFEEKHPGLFYCALFLFTYQLATLFDDLRALGSLAEVILHHFRG